VDAETAAIGRKAVSKVQGRKRRLASCWENGPSKAQNVELRGFKKALLEARKLFIDECGPGFTKAVIKCCPLFSSEKSHPSSREPMTGVGS
jgi:hypothetical protein